MISKELLQQVVNDLTVKEVITNHNNKIDNNIYYTVEEVSILQCVNIYELAHKCKLHFIKLGYEFDIQKDKVKISKRKDLPYYLTTITNTNQGDNFIPYDPYIDIKACQWILDNA